MKDCPDGDTEKIAGFAGVSAKLKGK